MNDADAIRRIRKTLSLAQGGTTEARTAWEKAQDLLQRYSLTMDDVFRGKRHESLLRLTGKRDKRIKTIPWGEFFRVERDEMITLQIKPDRSVQSGRAVESILNTFHSMHEGMMDRVWNEGFQVVVKARDHASYRIVYEAGAVTFYFVVPSKFQRAVVNSIENVWPHAAVQVVQNPIADLDYKKTLCAHLELRDHYFKATLVDRTRSSPIPSLVSAGRNVIEDDKAVLDVAFVPVSNGWQSRARSARERWMKGNEPRKLPSKWSELIFLACDALIDGVIEKAFGLIDSMFGAEPDKTESTKKTRDELQPATNQKFEFSGFNTVIRIASQSNNRGRADQTLRAIATSFKDISLDNEFEMKRAPRSEKFVERLANNQIPFSINSNILSLPEASQIVQMPSSALQDEYPEIQSIGRVETTVSEELFQDVPGIQIGEVTEKGITRKAKFPLSTYSTIKLKEIFDALCTPTFAFGKMGVGKTDGIGAGQALDMILAGYTAFLIDTADGQVAKTLTDALPDDYPEEKLIYLDYRNLEWLPPITYADVSETVVRGGVDSELAELQLATRLTSHLQEFLNEQSATGQLTDRMRRYFVSCAKATKGRPFYIELALSSAAYRDELLSDPFVLSQPDVVDDLRSLQDKAANGSISAVVDPILERLRMMSRNPFLANIFMSDDKRDADGRLLLDFRRFADNDEGGYGYCVVIVCDKDSLGPEGQELVCSTIQSKIFLAAYSRIDQDQSERKPFISIVDEPHRFIKGGAARRLYSDAAVELRKYRCRTVMLAHSPDQLGEVWDAFSSGGAQIIAYKSENLNDYKKISNQLAPYDAEYVYRNLPEKWEAVCKLRLPSGKESPAFFAHMTPPPRVFRDRSKRREECSQQFGVHWKEAMTRINEMRTHYQALDEQWFELKQEEEAARKQLEKERRALEREARKEKGMGLG